MARWVGERRPGPPADAAIGAAAGLVASWVMSRSYGPIWRLGSEETRRREQAAQGDLPPATVRAAEAAAATVGERIPDRRKGLGAHLVYGVATDAGWRLARAALR